MKLIGYVKANLTVKHMDVIAGGIYPVFYDKKINETGSLCNGGFINAEGKFIRQRFSPGIIAHYPHVAHKEVLLRNAANVFAINSEPLLLPPDVIPWLSPESFKIVGLQKKIPNWQDIAALWMYNRDKGAVEKHEVESLKCSLEEFAYEFFSYNFNNVKEYLDCPVIGYELKTYQFRKPHLQMPEPITVPMQPEKTKVDPMDAGRDLIKYFK